jgi:hypothetical protein
LPSAGEPTSQLGFPNPTIGYDAAMPIHATIQLQDVCQALDVRDRDARYVLEQGFVPQGVNISPCSGTHRQFTGGQAFWLGMVLRLKATGIKTRLAAQIADYAAQSVQTVTQSLGWESSFLPSQGRLKTDHRYLVEIADLTFVRFGSDASPSSGGKLEWFDWHGVTKPGIKVANVRPYVTIRLHVAEICRALDRAFARGAA